jgi:hypothetical protein
LIIMIYEKKKEKKSGVTATQVMSH